MTSYPKHGHKGISAFISYQSEWVFIHCFVLNIFMRTAVENYGIQTEISALGSLGPERFEVQYQRLGVVKAKV